MKNITYLLSTLTLCVLTCHSTHAFNLGKFTDKAAEAVQGATTDSNELLSMGSELLKSFKGNDQATSATKGLLQRFNAEDYLGVFDYYDQIKAAGLKPSQMQTWNDIKNPLSAIILERNFDFKESGLSDLVSKASSSLQTNDTKDANRYLTQLKDAATLTSAQKSLLQEILSNVLPVK